MKRPILMLLYVKTVLKLLQSDLMLLIQMQNMQNSDLRCTQEYLGKVNIIYEKKKS